jgi:hypothetical protein
MRWGGEKSRWGGGGGRGTEGGAGTARTGLYGGGRGHGQALSQDKSRSPPAAPLCLPLSACARQKDHARPSLIINRHNSRGCPNLPK